MVNFRGHRGYGEKGYSISQLRVAHVFSDVGGVVRHEDSNGGIVREIGAEMAKLWSIFEGHRGWDEKRCYIFRLHATRTQPTRPSIQATAVAAVAAVEAAAAAVEAAAAAVTGEAAPVAVTSIHSSGRSSSR